MVAMPFVVALRPVSSEARVGEHSAVVWKLENFTPRSAIRRMWTSHRSAEGVHRGVAQVVPGEEQDVRCPRPAPAAQVRRPVGFRVADVERDLALRTLFATVHLSPGRPLRPLAAQA